MILRPPRAADLAALTELCLASKAHWGYSAEFMAACVPVFTFTQADLSEGWWRVSPGVQGVIHITAQGAEAQLDKLFVAPDAMGQGMGRLLYGAATAQARRLGCTTLSIVADPGAVPFYRTMGARLTGRGVPSEAIPGRTLPELMHALDGPNPSP